MTDQAVKDASAPVTGSELIKKRRKSNFLILILLLVAVGAIYNISFVHLQNEAIDVSNDN